MSAARPTTPGRRAPAGLLGMLVLVAGIEAGITHLDRTSFTTNVAASWRYTGRRVGRQAPKADVLCFGDSLVKFGVQPPVLGPRLGRRVCNLALYAGPPSASYLMLRRALAAGARPTAVVVDFQPHLLADGPQFFVRHFPEFATVGECLDLACTTRDASFLAGLMVRKLLPSAKDRLEIRRNVVEALRGLSYTDALAQEIPAILRNWDRNAGAQAAARNPAYDGADNPADGALFPRSWRPDRSSRIYLQKFLRLARARGLRVYWLLPPLSPATQYRREQMGLDQSYTAFALATQARFPGLVVVDGRHARYPHTVFGDPVHLDHHGAAIFSEEVAEVLARDLAAPGTGPRWVGLPPFRDRPEAIAQEDTEQSRLALIRR